MGSNMVWVKGNAKVIGLNNWKNVMAKQGILRGLPKKLRKANFWKNKKALSRRQLPFFILFTVLESD